MSMTDDELRVAIAEKCGWVKFWEPSEIGESGCGRWLWHRGNKNLPRPPDYLTDLNAMHEAEKVLTGAQLSTYCTVLRPIVEEQGKGGFAYMFTATAKQRAEAFARVCFPERFNR